MTHPLDTWLRANDESRKAFAKRVGIDDSTLHRVINGTNDTNTATLRRISDATRGQVSEWSLYAAWLEARDTRRSTNKTDNVVSCGVSA